MTPFVQFRIWLRRGPTGERVVAAIAGAVVLALAVWALVPLDYDDNKTSVSAAGEFAPYPGADTTDTTLAADGAAPAADSPAAAATGGAGAATRTTTKAAATGAQAAAVNKCAGPLRATDQGVTANEVLVAVPIINLGGAVGNTAFGIRNDLEAVAHAAEAGINAEGGVGCGRKMKIKTYSVNPLDQQDTRSKCLDIIADKPFTVIEFGAYIDPVSRACFVEAKLPFQSALGFSEAEAKQGYPYLYTSSPSDNRQLRSWVFAAAERGTFQAANGFKKIGLWGYDCDDVIINELIRNLHSVGVTDAQMSIFRSSCSNGGTPNEIAQAMAQHRQDGVTHVLFTIAQIFAKVYVRNADQIQWKPTYVASDFGAITNTTSESDWSDGFANTVGITSLRGGEWNSGIKHKLVAPCQAWYTKAGVPPPNKDGDSAFGFCTFFRLFKSAADSLGANLTRSALIPEGLGKAGLFENITTGDITWTPGKVYGGDFIRAIQWRLDCHCWKVLDKDFRPAK